MLSVTKFVGFGDEGCILPTELVTYPAELLSIVRLSPTMPPEPLAPDPFEVVPLVAPKRSARVSLIGVWKKLMPDELGDPIDGACGSICVKFLRLFERRTMVREPCSVNKTKI